MTFPPRFLQRKANSRAVEDRESTDALLQDSVSEFPKDFDFQASYGREPPPSVISPANVLTILVCLGCTAVSWYISIVYPPHTYQGPLEGPGFCSISRNTYTKLKRPSPFIGFDQIHRSLPPVPRSLTNYPLAIALVNSSSTNQVFDDDPKRHFTRTGSVSPEDRLVMISNTISTIVQFRAIDYGMERCDLHVRILPRTIPPSPARQAIRIFLLDSEHILDTKVLSFSNRPSRISTVEMLSLSKSTSLIEWHREFACPWDSILTFELAYENMRPNNREDSVGHDVVRWWQDKDSDIPEEEPWTLEPSVRKAYEDLTESLGLGTARCQVKPSENSDLLVGRENVGSLGRAPTGQPQAFKFIILPGLIYTRCLLSCSFRDFRIADREAVQQK